MRLPLRLTIVGVTAVTALLVAGTVFRPPTAPNVTSAPFPVEAGGTVAVQGVSTDTVTELENRVERLPGDWSAWASLASARIELARVTGDPSQYGLAERAIDQSFEVRPDDNLLAELAASRLAAARHDFDEALASGRAAVAIAPANALAHLVTADALIELGRYDQAEAKIQEALDRRPALPALARTSYLRELRGDVDGAVLAMEQADALASSPADQAFTAFHLGQLAFDRGDLNGARAGFDAAIAADPGWVTPAAGRARLAAAEGDLDDANRRWDEVLERLPLPEFLTGAIDAATAAGDEGRLDDLGALLEAQQLLLADGGINVDLEIALAAAELGADPDAAVTAAEAAWERRQSIHTEDAYAWALHRADRSDEALPHARAALALGTRSATFHFHLAEIQSALGMTDDAAASYAEALTINPYFSPTHAARARSALAEAAG